MRVRISYSVDLEDVPSECARMLQESLEQLGEAQREIESTIDKLDDADSVGWQIKDQIDRCRQRLAKLDMILADNEMILEGYYKNKEAKGDEDVFSEG
jgi:Mg2+ and Co2+ transporter CorA